MSRRSQRSEVPSDKGPVLESLGACRQAMIGVQAKVRINGPVYKAASAILTAIDGMAAALTGSAEYFWDAGSSPTADQRRSRTDSCGDE
jgi:hypothetical protein